MISKGHFKALALLAPGAAWWLGHALPYEQRALAAIFALTVALWVTELMPLAVTALLSTALLVLFADVNEKTAFAAYGDPIIPLFIGSFLLAKAMEVTGLSERIAWWALRNRWAAGSAGRLLLAAGALSCAVSLFVSNTATAAMLLPIAKTVIASMQAEKTRFAIALLLMLTWGSSVAVGLPVGTPPNLIGIGLIERVTGRQISFLEWAAFGMPITIVMVGIAWLLLRILDLREPVDTTGAVIAAERRYRALPPMRASERATMVSFFVALFLWVAPDALAVGSQLLTGGTSNAVDWMRAHITPTVAALAGASLLFILPAHDRRSQRTLTWKEGARIDWGVILLFGGGIALGQAMFASGLANTLGEGIAGVFGAKDLWSITAIATAAAIVLSELSSNTTSATILVPVAIGLAQGAEVSPIAPALGATLGASFGFMLPVSTAPNAIVYSSGLIKGSDMARRGLAVDVLGFLVIIAGLRIILPLLGLA